MLNRTLPIQFVYSEQMIPAAAEWRMRTNSDADIVHTILHTIHIFPD